MKKLRLLPILLLACCVTEDNYLVKLGNVWCDRQEECNRADFEREYRDHKDCLDDFLDTWEPVQDCAMEAGCEYNPEEVRACRTQLRTESCEDFDDGDWNRDCDDTYDCTDSENIEVLVCLGQRRR